MSLICGGCGERGVGAHHVAYIGTKTLNIRVFTPDASTPIVHKCTPSVLRWTFIRLVYSYICTTYTPFLAQIANLGLILVLALHSKSQGL